jgi:hypothetical protein
LQIYEEIKKDPATLVEVTIARSVNRLGNLKKSIYGGPVQLSLPAVELDLSIGDERF